MLQEFIVKQNDMARGLALVGHAITSHPLKTIYAGVKVQAAHGNLLMTATDGEMTIRIGTEADIAQEGETVFPARLLTELVKRQSSESLTFTVDDKNTAKITGSGSKTSMACLEAEDFPDLPKLGNTYMVKLPAAALKNAISRVMFAVSTDESRKVLTGILMEFYPHETRLVSIDGFRLALIGIETENDIPQNRALLKAVVPGRVLSELAKILPDDDTYVVMTFDDSHCMFEIEGTMVLYTSLLVGEFVDYQKIIPNSAQTEAIIQKEPLMYALERCALMAREAKSNLITMELSENGLTMYSRAERGDVHEEVSAMLTGAETKISFNSQYLMDAVKNVDTEELRMMLNGGAAPCILRPKDGEQFTFLVLPVRTNA